MSQLNAFGLEWVDSHLDKIDEDKVYASIGAYDPEAFQAFFALEKERLTAIALKCQDDPEFQMRNQPKVGCVYCGNPAKWMVAAGVIGDSSYPLCDFCKSGAMPSDPHGMFESFKPIAGCTRIA